MANRISWAVRRTSSVRMRRNTFRISCQRSFGSLSDGFRQGLLSLTYGTATMKAATARATVSPSTRSAYEANLFARSNRAAKRLMPIPTSTMGDSKILNRQSQLKLSATYFSPNESTLIQIGALRLRPNRNREYAVYRASDFAMIQIRKAVGIRNRQPRKRWRIVLPKQPYRQMRPRGPGVPTGDDYRVRPQQTLRPPHTRWQLTRTASG